VQMYAPSFYQDGSSVSHFSTALSPDELMEPYAESSTGNSISFAALLDIGWDTAEEQYPPNIREITDKTMQEDGSLDITFVASDQNGDPLTYSLTGDIENLGASISGDRIRIRPVQNYFGIGTLTLTADDGFSTTAETFQVTVEAVNDAPVIHNTTSFFRTDEEVSVSFEIDATDVDSETLTYSLTGLSSDVTSSILGETVILTPALNVYGHFSFDLVVSDGSRQASKNIALIVDNINDPPYISVSDISIAEDNAWMGLLNYGDVDGSVPQASISADIEGTQVSIDTSGETPVLTVVPPANYNGDIQLTLVVTDGEYQVTDTFTLTVTSVNDAPVFGQIYNQSMPATGTLNIPLEFSDIDGDLLTAAVTNNPQGLDTSINGDILTITQNNTFTGTASLTLDLTDGNTSVSQTFLIEVGLENIAPVLTHVALSDGYEDTPTQFSVIATDANSDTLTYSITGLPQWITPLIQSTVSGADITLTPDENQSGDYTFTLIVNDSVLSDHQTISTRFIAVNDAPEFPETFATAVTLDEDGRIEIPLTATDAEGDYVRFAINTATAELGAQIIPDRLVIDPTSNFYGTGEVSLRAYDGKSC
ncbi:MAG: tandem-95 repeat protein, partial [Thalassolituus sp.]